MHVTWGIYREYLYIWYIYINIYIYICMFCLGTSPNPVVICGSIMTLGLRLGSPPGVGEPYTKRLPWKTVFIWMVVWLPSILFSQKYWVANHPNWRTHIFQRGGPTTNQLLIGKLMYQYVSIDYSSMAQTWSVGQHVLSSKKYFFYPKTAFVLTDYIH